jgi:hypothetical protein
MGRHGILSICAIACAAMAASCAVREEKQHAYNRIVGGTQTIYLTGYTTEFVPAAPPLYLVPARQAMAPLEGGRCTLRNDRGSWEADLPGEAVVTTGGELRIECRKDGYKPQRHTLGCSSPKARGAVGGALSPLLLDPRLTAFGIVYAPSVVVGVMAAGSVVGAEASAEAAGPEGRDACDYSRTAVAINLWPEEKLEEPW